jgi:hypothetical protein
MAFGLTPKSQDDAALHPADIEDIVRKSKRDILGLKIMVYTAVILLVGGFLYYNNALQSAQKNFDLEMRDTQSQLDTLMQDRALGAGNRLEGVVEEMNSTISRLDKEPAAVQQSIERVKEDSGIFLHTYRQYSKDKARAAKVRREFR